MIHFRAALVCVLVGLLGGPLAAAATASGDEEADPRKRVKALLALQGEGEAAVKAFRAALGDPSSRVRSAAVTLLAKELGPASAKEIGAMVDDPSDSVVISCVRALMSLGGDDIVEPVRKALAGDSTRVRVQAAGYIARADDARFVHDLGKLVSSGQSSVRSAALNAFQALAVPEAFPYAMAATADADPTVVGDALLAIMSIGDVRAVERLAVLAESDRAEILPQVARAIVHLGGLETHAETIRKLVAERTEVRHSVALALRDRPSPEGLPILDDLADGGDTSLRRLVVLALRANPAPASIAVLLKMIRDEDENVRGSVLLALGEKSVTTNLVALREAAADPSPRVRTAAAAALGRLGLDERLAALEPLLADGEASVRMAAATALGEFGNAAAAHLVARATQDPEMYVRLEAVRSLSRIGHPAALAYLREAVRSEGDAHVRVEAIRGLAQRRDPEDVALLREVSQDPAEVIRRTAREALAEIESAAAATEQP